MFAAARAWDILKLFTWLTPKYCAVRARKIVTTDGVRPFSFFEIVCARFIEFKLYSAGSHSIEAGGFYVVS